MNKKNFVLFIVFVLVLIAINNSLAADLQEKTVSFHGADSVFRKEGITVIWALLKGKDLSDSTVYITLNTTEEVRDNLKYYSVRASDPFSDRVEWLVVAEELRERNVIKLERKLFEELTAREILFYQDLDQDKDSFQDEEENLSIYYLSLPDTTPEFTLIDQLEKYFDEAEKRLNKIKKDN